MPRIDDRRQRRDPHGVGSAGGLGAVHLLGERVRETVRPSATYSVKTGLNATCDSAQGRVLRHP